MFNLYRKNLDLFSKLYCNYFGYDDEFFKRLDGFKPFVKQEYFDHKNIAVDFADNPTRYQKDRYFNN